MKISNIAQQTAQVVTQIGGGASNMYGSLMSFGEAVSKGDAGSILSTASGVISTANSIATLSKSNSKGSDAFALGAAATSLVININKLSQQVERNEPIKLTDVQNIIGDVFSIVGDTASLVGGKAGEALGVELNAIGLGIKAYGEATLGDQTMDPGDLFNADNWKGFAWDLAERWSKWVWDLAPDSINPWKENLNRDGKYHVYDPLVLDLDGDGIETVGTQGYAGVLFDHDKDGIRTATGWVAPDDGLLVIDRNGDGIINNGGELFGDSTVLQDGSHAAHGYAALAEFDTNSDGKVDAQDADFAKLKVWRDLNQDGVSQEGELFTLAELGIQSLDTAYKDVNTRLGNGNTVAQKGSYTLSDGTTREMGDLLLAADHLHSCYAESVNMTEEQMQAANLQGIGRLRKAA